MPCQISTKNKGFGMIPEPTKLQAKDFVLIIEFTDGQIRMSITWSNGFSLDPDVVYEDGVAVNSLPATGSIRDKVIAALNKFLQI